MVVETLQDAENILHARWYNMNAIDRAVIADRYRVLREMERYTHGTAKPLGYTDETHAAIDRMCATHNV